MRENEKSLADDADLERAIADYLLSLEGDAPLTPEEVIAANPQCAQQLRSFFANRSELEKLAKPLQSAALNPTIGAAAEESPRAGQRVRYFGDYELLEEVARGGMGVVYKARQTTLNRIVALKMIISGQLAGPEDIQRFRAEAEAAANLDHPNIVPIYEVGEHEGRNYYSMAFVEGDTLADRVAEGPLPPDEAAEIVRVVSLAIGYAHRRGVIHRDLKPANILLARPDKSSSQHPPGQPAVAETQKHGSTQGGGANSGKAAASYTPKVADFGLAKRVADEKGMTVTGQILGTPAYMPPEQAGGRVSEVTEAVDVYSLGAILYCLLAGRPPFQAATPLDTLQQVIECDPLPPRGVNPSIPRDLETIALKCLERSPANRYATAEELAEELARYQRGEPILARPINSFQRAFKWMRRHPAATAALLCGVLLLLALVAGPSVFALQQKEFANARQKHAEEVDQFNETLQDRAEEIARQRDKVAESLTNAHRVNALSIFDQAIAYGESGDHARCALLLVNALEKAELAGDEALQTSIRWNIGTWSEEITTLHQAIALEKQATALAINGDESLVAVAAGDVYLIDVMTGQQKAKLPHPDTCRSIDFHPDPRVPWLLTACEDGRARLWNIETGEQVHEGFEHGDADDPSINSFLNWGGVIGVGFTDFGKQAVTIGYKRRVCLWDTQSGEKLWEAADKRSNRTIGTFAFTPSRNKLFTLGNGWWLFEWDLQNRELKPPRNKSGSWAWSLAALDEEQFIVGFLVGEYARWFEPVGQSQSFMLRQFPHGGEVNDLLISHDRQWLVTACSDNLVRFWNLKNEALTLSPLYHPSAVGKIALGRSQTFLATTCHDGKVRIWRMARGRRLDQFRYHGELWSARFRPGTNEFATVGYRYPREALIGKVENRKLAPVVEVTGEDQPSNWGIRVAYAGDGERLYMITHQRLLTEIDAATHAVLSERVLPSGAPQSMEVSPDGQTLILGGSYGQGLQKFKQRMPLYDTKSWALRGFITLNYKCTAFAFSRDSSRILVGAGEGKLAWHNSRTGDWEIGTGGTLSLPIECLCLSPDETTAAIGGRDGRIIIVSTDDFRQIGPSMHHDGVVESVRFAHDGRLLVSAGRDATARVWDPSTGLPVGPKLRHESAVWEAHPSPEGDSILTSTHGGRLNLWKAPQFADAPLQELRAILQSAAQLKVDQYGAIAFLQLAEETRSAGESGLQGVHMSFSDQTVGDDSIAAIAGIKDLELVDLVASRVSRRGVEQLRELKPDLRVIWEGFEQDRAVALAVLKKGAKVSVLDGGQKREIQAIEELPDHPFQVDTVDFTNAEATDADLPPLAGLERLVKLVLWGRGITDEGLAHVGRIANLRELTLHDASVTGAGFPHLAALEDLATLRTGHGTPVTDEGLSNLPPFEKLVWATFVAGKISDEGIQYLARQPNLQALHLHWGNISGEGFRHLRGFRTLQLDHLKLSNDSLKHFEQLGSLQKLRLDHNPKIDDDGLAHLSHLQLLRELDLRDTSVTEQGVKQLNSQLPTCRIHWDGGTLQPTRPPFAP